MPEKIQRLRPSLNPRTRVPVASMLTTRPPKPSVVVVTITVVFVMTVAVVTVAVTVDVSSALILSYEIRFLGLVQDITNHFGTRQV
jgi:hypothetical protein